MKRQSGVLMNISSLPSPYGIGVIGAEAENFAKVRSMVQNALDNGMSSLKAPDSQVDICDYVMQHYPNTAENRKRIKEVTQYMIDNGITLEDVDDLRG